MSQKGEKYARRMERRVDKLEQDVAAITTEQTTQGVRISAVEDDLAVYRAAVSARELKQAAAEIKAAKERRTARAAERERKARRRNKVLAFIALALFVAVCVVMVAKAYSEEPAAEPATPEASAAPAAILPTELLFTAAEEEYMEDPQETEKIEEALLAQGYFSLAVPMPYEWQDYMRTYCEEYGCPYPLALAVAQTESNFDMDAVGASGEVGIMQLNPGPGGSYHAEIQAATGLDPTTTSGNIAGGCYKLGLYLAKYGSVEKAAMAYNMGEGGAKNAWAGGITSTNYSRTVKEAMETWECKDTEPQLVLRETAADDMDHWRGGDRGEEVTMVPVIMQGFQIYQPPGGGACWGVPLYLVDMIERDPAEHIGADVIDKDRLLWEADGEAVVINAVRKACSGWAKEWERAVWNALEGVDLHKEEAGR